MQLLRWSALKIAAEVLYWMHSGAADMADHITEDGSVER